MPSSKVEVPSPTYKVTNDKLSYEIKLICNNQKLGLIDDIHIRINQEKRQAFLENFDQKKFDGQDKDWRLLSYTTIFKNEIASYFYQQQVKPPPPDVEEINRFINTLKTCVQALSDIEYFINYPFLLDQQNLFKCIENYIEIINTRLQDEHFDELKQKSANFKVNLNNYFDNDAFTPEDLRKALSIQAEDNTIPCLGDFVAEQVFTLVTAGIDCLYSQYTGRLRQLFSIHPAIKALSNIKSDIEIKGYALYGVSYNNSRIPLSWIMMPSPREEKLQTEKKWLSLKPYVNHIEHNIVDLMICFFTHKKIEDHEESSHWYKLLVFAASILEFFLSLLRIAIIICSVFIAIFMDTSRWDTYCDKLHYKYSPVRWAKSKANAQYKRLDDDKSHQHQQILDQLKQKNTVSLYSIVLSEFASHELAKIFKEYVKQLVNNFLHEIKKSYYIIIYGNNKQVLQKEFEKLAYNENIPTTSLVEISREHWLPAQACEPNICPFYFKFFEEIISNGSNFFNRIFRLSPGIATSSLILSLSSLAVLVLPFYFGKMGAILRFLPEALMKGITGKNLSAGPITQCIAVFLEWKITYAFGEILEVIVHNDLYFLNILIEEAEKITLGLFVTGLVGHALAWPSLFPEHISIGNFEIPAVAIYPQIMNFFIEGAKESSANGVFPFNLLESIFRGTQFSLLLKSIFFKTENSKASVEYLHHHDLITHRLLESKPQQYSESDGSREDDKLAKTQLNDTIDKLEKALNKFEKIYNSNQYISMRDAHINYNYIDMLFDDYNQQVCVAGYFAEQINKSNYLFSFYNKYCYRSTNTLFGLLSIVPFYPLTLLWRLLKLAVASSRCFYSPIIIHEVNKSFSIDAAMIFQIIALINRVLRLSLRVSGLAIRTIFSLVLFILTFFLMPLIELFRYCFPLSLKEFSIVNYFSGWVSKINLHHINIIACLKPFYSRIARAAGLTSSDFVLRTTEINNLLKQSKAVIKNEQLTNEQKILREYQEKRKQSFFSINKKRDQQLLSISKILRQDTLSLDDKIKKIKLVQNSISNNKCCFLNSKLYQACGKIMNKLQLNNDITQLAANLSS